jgi:RecA-family ATPase
MDIEAFLKQRYDMSFDEHGWAACPFPENHKEGDANHPFHLKRESGLFNCFSSACFGGKEVDIYELVSAVDGIRRPDAERIVAKYAAFVSDGPIYRNGASETKITLHTRKAIELMKEASEVVWQVESILAKGAAMVVVADAGVGKTWFVLDLALAVDQGLLWLGHFEVQQGKVLILDEENADALLRRRLEKLLRAHEMAEDGSELGIEFLTGEGVNLSNAAYVAALDAVLDKMRPDLVIVDALVRIHQGNENDAGEMARLFGIFKQWMKRYGCSFVFCHHQRKPGIAGNNPSSMYRGSSEIRAFVDTHLDLRRVRGDEKGVFIVEQAKSRYDEPLPAFEVEVVDIAEGATAVRHLGDSNRHDKDKFEKALEFVDGLLADGEWHTRDEIEEKGKSAGFKRDMLDKARMQLVQSEELEEGKDGKKKRFRKSNFASDAPLLLIEPSETKDSQDEVEESLLEEGVI